MKCRGSTRSISISARRSAAARWERSGSTRWPRAKRSNFWTSISQSRQTWRRNSRIEAPMPAYDLVIRNGEVFDGSGGESFTGDVAVKDGRIAALGKVSGAGEEEIDAKGKIVTPGFVDVHTHYDGQATWENRMAPSSNHGVTSVVMGNCGVGFAPCRPH